MPRWFDLGHQLSPPLEGGRCEYRDQRRPAKFHFVNLSVALAFSPNRMTQISEFDALFPQERAKWIEWLVAQELFRRQCIAGVEDPEALWYWASKEHETDFVDVRENLYEVKAGRSGPPDFVWFAKTLPKRKLLVTLTQGKSPTLTFITTMAVLADRCPRSTWHAPIITNMQLTQISELLFFGA